MFNSLQNPCRELFGLGSLLLRPALLLYMCMRPVKIWSLLKRRNSLTLYHIDSKLPCHIEVSASAPCISRLFSWLSGCKKLGVLLIEALKAMAINPCVCSEVGRKASFSQYVQCLNRCCYQLCIVRKCRDSKRILL